MSTEIPTPDFTAPPAADPADDPTALAAVTASREQHAPVNDGVDLCFQTFGDPDDEPLLLVMGLSGPMNWWDEPLCRMLARRGFYVIRYDNRDTGRSSRIRRRVPLSWVVRAFVGLPVDAPYGIGDLADDAAGLLDHLGLASAHVVGVSMGGMIVQHLALHHPGRVRSMVSIMSTTGRRTVGWQHPRLLPALVAPRRGGKDTYVETSARFWGVIGSPGYPDPEEVVRARAAETWDRGVSNAGTLRHMLAVITQDDRTRDLHALRVPTLVIHGDADLMVNLSGGRATARAVPDAELVVVPGMGHDVPEPLYPTFADAIRRTADRAG
ncbi:alpha/beta hydrolase [Nocardioides lentus]|uniref:Alpha/beta hydrolase n=1 Tax=Nocardioides lentus TaxID=338077 RepID=A0ABP5AR19_9ACTN